VGYRTNFDFADIRWKISQLQWDHVDQKLIFLVSNILSRRRVQYIIYCGDAGYPLLILPALPTAYLVSLSIGFPINTPRVGERQFIAYGRRKCAYCIPEKPVKCNLFFNWIDYVAVAAKVAAALGATIKRTKEPDITLI